MAAPHSQACHPLARTPAAPYPAHMNVVGNNGIWMYGSSNVWIKNVRGGWGDGGERREEAHSCS